MEVPMATRNQQVSSAERPIPELLRELADKLPFSARPIYEALAEAWPALTRTSVRLTRAEQAYRQQMIAALDAAIRKRAR